MTEFIKTIYVYISVYMFNHHKEIDSYTILGHDWDEEKRKITVNIQVKPKPLQHIEVTIEI